MKQKISVDKAIRMSYLLIFTPMIIIMLASFCITFCFFEILSLWSLAIPFISMIISPLLFWLCSITKWRVWAFENVVDVHRLKTRAIKEGLIWKKDNWLDNSLGKIEFISSFDKMKWKRLQERFKEVKDVDYQLFTRETVIYYSKIKTILWLIFALIMIGIGINNFILESNTDIGVLMAGMFITLMGLFFTFYYLKKFFNSNPQIIINDRGIKTKNTNFIKWDDITNEAIKKTSKHTFSLIYNYPNGFEKLTVNDFNISVTGLRKLLKVYRMKNDRILNKRKSTNG